MLGGNVSFRDVAWLFNVERVYLAARALGNAQAAFEASLKYAKERRAFGNPIASYQAIKFRLTEAAMNLEAGRLLTYKAAWLRDQGKPFVKEASMAKIFTSQVAERICLDAMHIHGGYGVMSDLPIQRYVRDIGTFQIGGGTTEMQHLRIAREIGI
jgi:alkylation response protein AidB-like acyl-CoA dehydrogenase